MGPWITDAELLQAIADMLHKDIGDLDPIWGRVATDSNVAAANDIAQILLGRGYTPAQVNAFDLRTTFNRDIALFWALTKGGGLADYSDTHILKLDRRKELATLLLLIGGTPVAPGAPADTGGGAGGGRLSEEGYRIRTTSEF